MERRKIEMRKLLSAIILVICFSGVANAESWVLWLGFDDTRKITWQIEAEFPSSDQCSERLLQICKAGKGVLNPDSSCVIRQEAIFDRWTSPELHQKALFFITRLCLPDTVDPRK